MNIDANTTALLIVDMQNGFCHPDGSLYAEGSKEVIEPIQSILERARAKDMQVVFTRDVHPPNQFDDAFYYDEFERWGEHVVEGTWEAEIVDELRVQDEDEVVVKHTYDAFYQTNLEGFLESHQLKTLCICGTLANVCVLHTAGSAGLRDYRPIILTDAVGCIEPGHREYALDHAEWLFGETTSSDAIQFTS